MIPGREATPGYSYHQSIKFLVYGITKHYRVFITDHNGLALPLRGLGLADVWGTIPWTPLLEHRPSVGHKSMSTTSLPLLHGLGPFCVAGALIIAKASRVAKNVLHRKIGCPTALRFGISYVQLQTRDEKWSLKS